MRLNKLLIRLVFIGMTMYLMIATKLENTIVVFCYCYCMTKSNAKFINFRYLSSLRQWWEMRELWVGK